MSTTTGEMLKELHKKAMDGERVTACEYLEALHRRGPTTNIHSTMKVFAYAVDACERGYLAVPSDVFKGDIGFAPDPEIAEKSNTPKP